MKKALFKDSVKEIKNTYKRFISILLMAFLGVGFFAGIRATSPDMVDTIDKYYDEHQEHEKKKKEFVALFKECYSDIVKIIDGEFKGVTGKVARIAGQQRVVVEIAGVCMVATAYIPSIFIKVV